MHLPATRKAARQLLGPLQPSARKSLFLSILCLLIAWGTAFVPSYQGLAEPGVLALFILVLCAGLWISEAMPAFAVSLLAIGLEIALLGHAASENADWEKYIATWGSPLIWLFFGGFILAEAAKKTELDLWMATHAIRRFGNRPAIVLLGVMVSTAVLSMFLSNTATATMMVAVLGPLLVGETRESGYPRALLLGIAMAANIGGMGTLIGTPPNAIAVGALADMREVNFAEWMLYGAPPALCLLALAWGYLLVASLGRGCFRAVSRQQGSIDSKGGANENVGQVPRLQQAVVILTFAITVSMWMTSPWHGIPTTVVSFIPICALTTLGILDRDDVKCISWDVLLLIAGGLSLGVAVSDTGLASWLVSQLPFQDLSPVTLALSISYVAILLSNLMSNTAAANIILPIMLVLLGSEEAMLAVPVALSASAAMCLPISTPPNAIVYGTQRLRSVDLLWAGLVIGVVTPPIVLGWTLLVESLR